MKKFFTLVAMATMALAANAQTESGFANENDFSWEDRTNDKGVAYKGCNMETGTTFAQTAHVNWHAESDFEYQYIAMCGEADKYNTVTIDGVAYPMGTAYQATGGNGKDCDASHAGPSQIGGSEQFYTCTATGYLYVFSKTSNNKKYYVYDGDIASKAGNEVAYTQFMGDQSSGTIFSYTLPADNMGYVQWPDADASYPTDYFLSNKAYNEPQNMPNCKGMGAALGVIAFPVWGTPDFPITYAVFASGSKLTTNGFVFVPAENPTLEGLSTPTFSLGSTGSSIQNVEAVENVKAAPVKVIKNGQIMIGDFNIAGQRVK